MPRRSRRARCARLEDGKEARTNPAPGFARNPGKAISVEPVAGAVTVTAGGVVIAKTTRALRLLETPYPPVLYVPFADIDFSQLEKTAHASHCPYKGDASYWSVSAAGARGVNAMWAYERPFDEMAAICDHGAFHPDRVAIATG